MTEKVGLGGWTDQRKTGGHKWCHTPAEWLAAGGFTLASVRIGSLLFILIFCPIWENSH